MSYILEALRRAETERERKRRVPGLHAQPVAPPSPEEPGRRRSKAWLWVVVGVSAGVLLPLLWRSWTSEPISEESAGAHGTVAGSVTPQGGAGTDARPADAPTTPEPPPANPPSAAAPAAPERPPASRATHAAPKAGATAKTGPATPPDATTRTPNAATPAASPAAPDGASARRTTTPAPPAAAASAPEPRLRSMAELPDELRRAVPPLAFGGSVYSETPAQRMVIFNGQVLREGDAVSDELVLEQIRARSAVMRLRGQRFEIAF
jgi:general secretion pathway protein B